MFTSSPYATLGQVKVAIDPNMTTTDDAFLQDLLIQAQADIDREIGYQFQTDGTLALPATRLYDGQGTDTLLIDDCLSLVTVKEVQRSTYLNGSGYWQLGSTLTYDITADCVLKPNNLIPAYMLKRISGLYFTQDIQNYTLTGIFGQPSIPADITRITVRLAVHYYKMRDTDYANMLQEQGGIRLRYVQKMPDDVVEVINRYKRRLIIGRSD